MEDESKSTNKGYSVPCTGYLTPEQTLDTIKSVLCVKTDKECLEIVDWLKVFICLERDYARVDCEQDEDRFIDKYAKLYNSMIQNSGPFPKADHLFLELSIHIREGILCMMDSQ